MSRVIGAATPRSRVAIVLLAFSGLVPRILGDAEGSDGLRLSDFLEGEVTVDGLRFPELPAVLHVRPPLSSQRSRYTGVCAETLTYINEFLCQRMREEEAVAHSSSLLSRGSQPRLQNAFVPTAVIEREIQEAIMSAGFPWHMEILRDYFETNLRAAHGDGKITSMELAFLSSHASVISETLPNRDQVSPSFLRRIRLAYDACKPYLSTVTYPVLRGSLPNESNGWIYI